MASGPITSLKINIKKVDTMSNFIFLGYKINVEGDCSHDIKRHLFLYSYNKHRQGIQKETLFCQQGSIQLKLCCFFFFFYSHVWMSELDHQKNECQSIDALKIWFWRRLLGAPWTARRSNQSILKKINPEQSLEVLMLRLKLQYFGHLMQRANSLKKTLMLRARGEEVTRGSDSWMASLTQWT